MRILAIVGNDDDNNIIKLLRYSNNIAYIEPGSSSWLEDWTVDISTPGCDVAHASSYEGSWRLADSKTGYAIWRGSDSITFGMGRVSGILVCIWAVCGDGVAVEVLEKESFETTVG